MSEKKDSRTRCCFINGRDAYRRRHEVSVSLRRGIASDTRVPYLDEAPEERSIV